MKLVVLAVASFIRAPIRQVACGLINALDRGIAEHPGRRLEAEGTALRLSETKPADWPSRPLINC